MERYRAKIEYKPDGPEDPLSWRYDVYRLTDADSVPGANVAAGWAATRAEAIAKADAGAEFARGEAERMREPEWIDL
jgi:hypothetical protein